MIPLERDPLFDLRWFWFVFGWDATANDRQAVGIHVHEKNRRRAIGGPR